MIARIILIAALPLAAACTPDAATQPASDEVQMISEDGVTELTIQVNEDGGATVELPGLSIDADFADLDINMDDVDVAGVPLPANSRLRDLKVEARSEGAEVIAEFLAPEDLATTRRYFADAFQENGIENETTASGFTGVGTEGEAFTLTLDQAETGTLGRLTIEKPAT
ncbi:MAG: hypothetical protein WA906_04405 [Pacificimonas sp.]